MITLDKILDTQKSALLCLAFRYIMCVILLGYVLLFSISVSAGSSIFWGHKSHSRNSNGVNSIGVHICGSLTCPDVIFKEGDCTNIPHASMEYGVCTCDDGYFVQGTKCVKCPSGEYSDGTHGCAPCPVNTYRDKTARKCLSCPEKGCPVKSEEQSPVPSNPVPDETEPEITLWEPSSCGSDADCNECEQCVYGICIKVQTEECPCTNKEMIFSDTGDGKDWCIPCGLNSLMSAVSATDCTNCNRKLVSDPWDETGQACALKKCPKGYVMDNYTCYEDYCQNVECESGYICDDGDCVPCDALWELYYSPSCATACPNRKTEEGDGYELCILKDCPAGYVRMDWGECAPDCSDYSGTDPGFMGGEVPDKPDCRCPTKKEWNTISCQCIDGYVEDSFGNCQPCADMAENQTSCEACGTSFKWCSANNKCINGNNCCTNVTTSACLLCDTETGIMTKPGASTSCDYAGGTNNGECNGNGSCVKKKTFQLLGFASSSSDAEELCPSGYSLAYYSDIGDPQPLANGVNVYSTVVALPYEGKKWTEIGESWARIYLKDWGPGGYYTLDVNGIAESHGAGMTGYALCVSK